MFEKFVGNLIERAQRTPYYHLYHRDGSPYMLRYWLMPQRALKWIEDRKPVDAGLRPAADELGLGYELRDDVRHLPAARLHNICTADLDREFHNHPWSFISIVLRGGYVERRPLYQEPRFEARAYPVKLKDIDFEGWNHEYGVRAAELMANPPMSLHWEEPGYNIYRRAGSIAFRSYNDRHRIVHVLPDTWTLILLGPKRQTWGFFTKQGFVNWREFSSAHNIDPL